MAIYVFLALRIYLIISIGLLLVKAVAAIVDTLDAFTARTDTQVARDFRKRIIEAFRREGIEIPYPHQVSIDKASTPEA